MNGDWREDWASWTNRRLEKELDELLVSVQLHEDGIDTVDEADYDDMCLDIQHIQQEMARRESPELKDDDK